MASRLRVVFLYRAAHSSSGSKIMRVDQLCGMAKRHLGERYDFETVELPKKGQNRRISRTLLDLTDAVVILLKRADVTFGAGHVDLLKGAARAVVIDHVDAGIDASALEVADLHIAASVDGLAGMADAVARIAPDREVATALLPHHADPRITWHDRTGDDGLRMGYFGLRDHAIVPAALEARLHVPDYDLGAGIADMIMAMDLANVHYAVRPPKRVRNSWKPFTKGINAAAAGSNVLVHRGVDDALATLGADYPYMIDDGSEEAILDGVTRLEGSVGGPEWRRGLEVMAALRERTSEVRLMHDLAGIIERVA